jgi:hypothetical protein
METATEEVKAESLYANAIKHGLILGTITIILTIVAYATSLSFMGSFKFLGSVFAIYIGYVIYAGITYRNSIGRYISYGKAFIHGFLVLAVAGLVNFVFGIVLYDVVDTELSGKMAEVIISNTEDTMRNFGAPEEQIDKSIEEMRRTMPENFSMVGRIKNYFLGLIWYAVFVAITSLVVRKNEPVEL